MKENYTYISIYEIHDFLAGIDIEQVQMYSLGIIQFWSTLLAPLNFYVQYLCRTNWKCTNYVSAEISNSVFKVIQQNDAFAI